MAADTAKGFAVFAGVSPEIIRASAREAEALGFASFWVNHPGPVDGLGSLAHAAAETRRIDLGVGRHPAAHARARRPSRTGVREHGLAPERLLLGRGQPESAGAQARARRRGRDPDKPDHAGHRGRARARRCAGWPARSPTACSSTGSRRSTRAAPPSWCARARSAAKRPMPRLYAYVRVALGPAAVRAARRRGRALRRHSRVPRPLRPHGREAGGHRHRGHLRRGHQARARARGTAPSTRSSSAPSPPRTRSRTTSPSSAPATGSGLTFRHFRESRWSRPRGKMSECKT